MEAREIVIGGAEAPASTPTVEETETENTSEQTHIVPEIEVKKKFFDFTGGKDYMTLKLTAAGVRVESAETGKMKNVSYQGLVKSLSQQATLDTGILPVIGAEYVAVRRYMILKNRHYVFIEVSPRMRKISYAADREGREQKYEIPFPGLMFAAVLREDANGRTFFSMDESRMYALQSPVFNDNTKMYRYPFSNVYEDAHICWGNTLESMSRNNYQMNVMQAASLIEYFLGGENNNDLYNPRYAHRKDKNYLDNLKDLNKKPLYPSETLQEYMDFRSVVSLLTQNQRD